MDVTASFLKSGAFDAQNIVTVPHAKLLRKLGTLRQASLTKSRMRCSNGWDSERGKALGIWVLATWAPVPGAATPYTEIGAHRYRRQGIPCSQLTPVLPSTDANFPTSPFGRPEVAGILAYQLFTIPQSRRSDEPLRCRMALAIRPLFRARSRCDNRTMPGFRAATVSLSIGRAPWRRRNGTVTISVSYRILIT